jgi:hypothetical protein
MKDLLVPWLASSLAFSLMQVAWMFVTFWLETATLPPPLNCFDLQTGRFHPAPGWGTDR